MSSYDDDSLFNEGYARSQEEAEVIKESVESCCCKCALCKQLILPGETAVTFDSIKYYHDWHLGERSGDDLAVDNGADPDTVADYKDIFD